MNKEKLIDKAFELSIENTSYNTILDTLKTDDEFKKPIYILKLNEIKSQEDANIFISHLTNQGGMVREAVAIKIVDFLNSDYKNFFQTNIIIEKITDGLIDINPNISRLLIESLNKIQNQKYLEEKIMEKLIFYIEKIENWQDKKNHTYNKLFFKIYWLLEGISEIQNIDIVKKINVLDRVVKLNEYTTKEKVAKLIKKFDFVELYNLKQKLKNDKNYYVRRILNED